MILRIRLVVDARPDVGIMSSTNPDPLSRFSTDFSPCRLGVRINLEKFLALMIKSGGNGQILYRVLA